MQLAFPGTAGKLDRPDAPSTFQDDSSAHSAASAAPRPASTASHLQHQGSGATRQATSLVPQSSLAAQGPALQHQGSRVQSQTSSPHHQGPGTQEGQAGALQHQALRVQSSLQHRGSTAHDQAVGSQYQAPSAVQPNTGRQTAADGAVPRSQATISPPPSSSSLAPAPEARRSSSFTSKKPLSLGSFCEAQSSSTDIVRDTEITSACTPCLQKLYHTTETASHALPTFVLDQAGIRVST